MSNPLALLPLAIAAGGGHIAAAGDADVLEAQQMVAAGLTLLQRSAPLVRALSGRRSAILMPTSPQFLTALAASEGRAAVLVNPLTDPAEIAVQCRDGNVGALFTTRRFASCAPDGVVVVILDDAPRAATVLAGGASRGVDLGTHHGLSLEGERDVPGRDEEAAIIYTAAMHGLAQRAVLTHANLLATARSTIEALANTADDHVLALLPFAHLFGLTVACTAPLIAGARISTMEHFHPTRAVEVLASEGITEIVGSPAVFHAMLSAIERRGITLRGSALRLAVCGGAALSSELRERWADATGVEIHRGYGLPDAPAELERDRLYSPRQG